MERGKGKDNRHEEKGRKEWGAKMDGGEELGCLVLIA